MLSRGPFPVITTLLRVVLFPLRSKKKLRVLEFIRSHASSKQQRPAGRGHTAASSDGGGKRAGVFGQGLMSQAGIVVVKAFVFDAFEILRQSQNPEKLER